MANKKDTFPARSYFLYLVYFYSTFTETGSVHASITIHASIEMKKSMINVLKDCDLLAKSFLASVFSLVNRKSNTRRDDGGGAVYESSYTVCT